MNCGTGYLKDANDPRDYSWRAAVRRTPKPVPARFINSTLGPVLDQGDEPKCVAFSAASLKFHQEFQEHRKYYAFDPHWLYALCKQQDGIPNADGTFIRTALQIIGSTGYLAKAEKYKLRKDTHFPISNYIRLHSLNQVREALYTHGPVMFGLNIDEGLYTPDGKGIIPEPNGRPEGGHAMLAVGYDDNKKCKDSVGAFYVKNSWGENYGLGGYVWIPYTHFNQYPDWDAWRTVDASEILPDYDPMKGLE